MKCQICQLKMGLSEQNCKKCNCNFHIKCANSYQSTLDSCLGCKKQVTDNTRDSSGDEDNASEILCIVERKTHPEWQSIIKEHLPKVEKDIENYYSKSTCYPPKEQIFTWSEYPLSQVKVVILGQDPYINFGEAHGLSFSVPDGKKVPPSLKNIYKAIEQDTGKAIEFPTNGNLLGWSKQGVLLLNTALTVKEGKSNSHASTWMRFTKIIIKHIASTHKNIVFLLWGNFAHSKSVIIEPYVKNNEHLILKDGHPSPLNTKHRFVGTKCFSCTNNFLEKYNNAPIEWHKHLP